MAFGCCSYAVVLFLFIRRLLLLLFLCGFCIRSLFCNAVYCVLSCFAITSLWMRELVSKIVLSYWCVVAIIVLCLFLKMLLVGVQFVIVAFPGQSILRGTRSLSFVSSKEK